MHAGIANWRFPLKSVAGKNLPGIPVACATRNFTYLVIGPWDRNIQTCKLLCNEHGFTFTFYMKVYYFLCSETNDSVKQESVTYCVSIYRRLSKKLWFKSAQDVMAEWLGCRTRGCRLHVTLRPGVRIPVLPRVIYGVALSRRLSSGGWLQST